VIESHRERECSLTTDHRWELGRLSVCCRQWPGPDGVWAASEDLEGWPQLLVVAGVLVLTLDVIESPAFLTQTKGVMMLAKPALLGGIVVSGKGEWLLTPILFVSVVSSHAPSGVRYRVLVFGERVRGKAARTGERRMGSGQGAAW